MENWDEEKLNEVVEQKHGETNKSKPKTEIVSIALLYKERMIKTGLN